MPTPREQLAVMLKQSRLDGGFESHGSLAKRLNVSRPVVSKAENPVHPVPSDALLVAWAEATGTDADELADLAQRSKSGTPDWFIPYLTAEARATMLRSWAPLIIPGLLQTEAYAHAVLSIDTYTPAELDQLLSVRLERQKVLDRAYFTAVIDASVLARCIGDAPIMAEQCAHLADVAERPNVSLHVVPADMNTGAWGALDVASRDGLVTLNYTTTVDDVTTTGSTGQIDRALRAYERVLGFARGRG